MDPNCTGREIKDYPVYWIGDIESLAADHLVITAIVASARAASVHQNEDLGFDFMSLIHNKSEVADKQNIGNYVIIAPNVSLAAKVQIADHVYINRNSSFGHHTRIGSYSTIGPEVHLGGNCHIGNGVEIGIGATVIDNFTIRDGAVITAGALVALNVKPGAWLFQMPTCPRPVKGEELGT